MPDDLQLIAPSDPARVVAGWPETRQRILDDITQSPVRRGPSRAISGLAAAAALVLVALMGALVLVPPPSTQMAGAPTPAGRTVDPRWTDATTPVAARGVLVETQNGGMTLCDNVDLGSSPSQCRDGLPVVGLAWGSVPGRGSADPAPDGQALVSVVVVGTYDGSVLHGTAVHPDGSPDAPAALEPFAIADDLCSPPGRAGGPAAPPTNQAAKRERTAARASAEQLPGLVAAWWGPDARVLNVIVDSDRAGAERRLRTAWAGPLCVSVRPHPTEAELMRVQSSLQRAGIDSSVEAGSASAGVPAPTGGGSPTGSTSAGTPAAAPSVPAGTPASIPASSPAAPSTGLMVLVKTPALTAATDATIRQAVEPAMLPYVRIAPRVQRI